MPVERDYDRVIGMLAPQGDRQERMQHVVDALWDELGPKGCSWVGFYLKTPDVDELVLGPRRDKPACSPIGLFGACGRAFHSRKPLVVTNVANLKAGYIACDPRDRSEVVVPCMEMFGEECWGVLDADSHDVHSFTERDVLGLQRVLAHAGLTPAASMTLVDVV
jgi:putative methionine-R-sulfoxide reductase with GAF domain